MLTDLSLRSHIKNPPKIQTDFPDAGCPGLSARITAKGRVTWSLRIRIAGEGGQSVRGRRAKGQQYRLSLGVYPGISIKAARATATEFGKKAEEGEHPVRDLERKAVGRHDTVARLVERFLADYAEPNIRSWKNAKSTLNLHIVPAWGRRPVNSIDDREAVALLLEVAKGRIDPTTNKRVPRPGAAGEVRKWGSLLYSWAVRSGLAARNPFEKARNPIKLKPRQRFLDMPEARAVWLAAAELEHPWGEIIQLLLLTACRLREIAHARWSWVNETDARIVIPGEFYKTGKTFLVALPSDASSILAKMPRWNAGDYIFSTDGGVRPVWSIPRKVVVNLHRRAEVILGRKIEHFVRHDFRRTIRSHLPRLKVPEVVGELVLGHALRGVAGTYNVYDFETEKRAALELWATQLRSSDVPARAAVSAGPRDEPQSVIGTRRSSLG